ncbi:MAG: LCP family protein [Clostridium sp.]|nr:LCP family protein [Clostridium sp.]
MKKKVIISIVAVLLVILASVGGYGYKVASNIKKVEVTPEELGIKPKASEKTPEEVKYGTFRPEERYLNIALLGVDTRTLESYENTRADSIMILSIDRENKSLSLASVARDTYVSIENHGMDKVNHAYAFGGAPLAVKTLNQNFDLNVTDFAVVNFFGLAKIIDRLGGVEIEVDDEELQTINGCINEVASIQGVEPRHVEKSGLQILDGTQAVAYSRIRSTAGGDFKRTERQREVLISLAKKNKDVKLTDIMPIVTQLSTNLMTTLEPADMINLSAEVITEGYQSNIKETMFPESEYAGGEIIDGIYYYVTDLDKTKEGMHEFLFSK